VGGARQGALTLPPIVHLRLGHQVGGHMAAVVEGAREVGGQGPLFLRQVLDAGVEAALRVPEIHGPGCSSVHARALSRTGVRIRDRLGVRGSGSVGVDRWKGRSGVSGIKGCRVMRGDAVLADSPPSDAMVLGVPQVQVESHCCRAGEPHIDGPCAKGLSIRLVLGAQCLDMNWKLLSEPVPET
jgi:hypothetical protein